MVDPDNVARLEQLIALANSPVPVAPPNLVARMKALKQNVAGKNMLPQGHPGMYAPQQSHHGMPGARLRPRVRGLTSPRPQPPGTTRAPASCQ
jgi:hypothetical protein